MLVVIAGLPGSGKSTMAADLGRALNCAVLGVDQAEAAMWRAGVSPSGPTHHAAYLVAGALAAEQLALGHDVIIDAVNGLEQARAQWRLLARETGAELKFIVVECGDDRIYRDRVEHRTRNIEGFPEPTWEGVLRRRAQFPPWTDERLTIDSVNSRASNLQAALEYLPASAAPNPDVRTTLDEERKQRRNRRRSAPMASRAKCLL
jgi:predicted kinase